MVVGAYNENDTSHSNLSTDCTGYGSNKTTSEIVREGPYFDFVEKESFGILVYPLSIIVAYITFGLLGNVTVLYIFGVKWRRNKTSVFIITLALLDVINCSINMPIEIFVLSKPLSFDFDMLCKLSRCFSYITTASYSFVLVAVAFDRYLMVCRPLTRMTLGKKYATRTCIAAVLVGVITQFPSVFIYGTYVFCIHIPSLNITVEGKTCLVTNYHLYVEPTLTYAFQGFLFAGHVVIFSALTVIYIIIGRRLFISSKTDVGAQKASPTVLKKSIISAITGSVLCGSKAKSISTDNIPVARYVGTAGSSSRCELATASTQRSDDNISPSNYTRCHYTEGATRHYKKRKSKSLGNIYLHSLSPLHINGIDKKRADQNGDLKKKRSESVGITTFDKGSEDETEFGISETKTVMDIPTPTLIPRSISIDGTRLFSTCVEMPRSQELKEISLKRNTLIMRMVTFTFMLSYLPFLIIVTLRYSNPEIPLKLDRPLKIVYHVFLRSYFFNSVTRPFIYSVMNDDFRKSVVDILQFLNVFKICRSK